MMLHGDLLQRPQDFLEMSKIHLQTFLHFTVSSCTFYPVHLRFGTIGLRHYCDQRINVQNDPLRIAAKTLKTILSVLGPLVPPALLQCADLQNFYCAMHNTNVSFYLHILDQKSINLTHEKRPSGNKKNEG